MARSMFAGQPAGQHHNAGSQHRLVLCPRLCHPHALSASKGKGTPCTARLSFRCYRYRQCIARQHTLCRSNLNLPLRTVQTPDTVHCEGLKLEADDTRVYCNVVTRGWDDAHTTPVGVQASTACVNTSQAFTYVGRQTGAGGVALATWHRVCVAGRRLLCQM